MIFNSFPQEDKEQIVSSFFNYMFDVNWGTPPENETLIIKDIDNEYHIGYYRNGLYIKSGGYILNAISWRPLFYE